MSRIKNVSSEELVVFSSGDISCALEIGHIREINRDMEITPVYRAPKCVRGVINLRGEIVTVIDLSVRLGKGPTCMDEDSRILIIKSRGGESVGLLSEKVQDIVIFDPTSTEPPPPNLSGVTGSFFKAIYKMKNVLAGILDIDELLAIS